MYPKCVPDVSKMVVIYEAAFFLSRGGGGGLGVSLERVFEEGGQEQ